MGWAPDVHGLSLSCEFRCYPGCVIAYASSLRRIFASDQMTCHRRLEHLCGDDHDGTGAGATRLKMSVRFSRCSFMLNC